MQKHRPKSTPWGTSQTKRVQAEGIVWYETASHGGFHLSPERQAEFEERFPWFETFAGGPWYEEDQDWAAVALAFSGLFTHREIAAAVRTARHAAKPFRLSKPGDDPEFVWRWHKWERIVQWLDSAPEATSILQVAGECEIGSK